MTSPDARPSCVALFSSLDLLRGTLGPGALDPVHSPTDLVDAGSRASDTPRHGQRGRGIHLTRRLGGLRQQRSPRMTNDYLTSFARRGRYTRQRGSPDKTAHSTSSARDGPRQSRYRLRCASAISRNGTDRSVQRAVNSASRDSRTRAMQSHSSWETEPQARRTSILPRDSLWTVPINRQGFWIASCAG